MEVVSSVERAQLAVASAQAGDVVCITDGTYGEMSLSARGPVVLRAQHPGRATIGPTMLEGRGLRLARFEVDGEIEVMPGSSGITVAHDRITGGYFGVDAGPTTTSTVNDVSIIGNQFVGPFGEDAIRLNRYHDGNGDGIGALIEGNEFTKIRENGNHSDCLQTVWVGDHLVFRRNYLHDNRCQGFFVNDQASPIHGIRVEDNLFLRDTEPCAASDPGCGQPLYFQVFGPYTGFVMRRNTIWARGPAGGTAAFRNGSGAAARIEANVVRRFWTDTNMSQATMLDNLRCRLEAARGGSWPRSSLGERDCAPPFRDPAEDDYRLGGGRGVDWAPAAQSYGP